MNFRKISRKPLVSERGNVGVTLALNYWEHFKRRGNTKIYQLERECFMGERGCGGCVKGHRAVNRLR